MDASPPAVVTSALTIPTGAMTYLDFMTPGVLAQSVLFTAIFYGIAVIWDRDFGILHKMLITPRTMVRSSSAKPCRPDSAASPRR